MKRVLLLMGVAVLAVTAQAAIVAEYDYTDAAGADPQLQGWLAYNLGKNDWASGGDYTGEGWVIADGTSTTGVAYQTDLVPAAITSFTLTADVTLLSDVYKNDGTFLDDWHRTNDNNNGYGFWIENSTAGYMYLVKLIVVGEDLVATDGTNETVVAAGTGFDVAHSIVLTGDGTGASLSVDGGTAIAVDVWGAGLGFDRVLFGQNQGAYFGTSETRLVSLDTTVAPEPATMILLGLGGLILSRRRV